MVAVLGASRPLSAKNKPDAPWAIDQYLKDKYGGAPAEPKDDSLPADLD
jgi:hypothetical protein